MRSILPFSLALAGGCLVAPAPEMHPGEGDAGGEAPGDDDDPGLTGGEISYGTLVSLPEHTEEEAEAGISIAMVELVWRDLEPVEGVFDQGLLGSVRAELAAHRAAGRSITLAMGLHMPPDWVFEVPDARMVDDLGNASDEVNLVFNQEVRDAAAAYLAAVDEAIDLAGVDVVRLTAGGTTEVLYPGDGTYWAFDDGAQNGPRMPPTMAANPVPGWRPAEGGDPAEARAFAGWYVDALVDVVLWQADVIRGLGFGGLFEVLTPGLGVRPRELEEAIAAGLPHGLLGVGAVWHELYAALPDDAGFVVYVSSVADSSGDDRCTQGDVDVPLDAPEVETWSSARWQRRIADEHGFAIGGENPGYHVPPEYDDVYDDLDDRGMMAQALRQVRSCGYGAFYWAHDAQLWDGTIPFEAFAAAIATAP